MPFFSKFYSIVKFKKSEIKKIARLALMFKIP